MLKFGLLFLALYALFIIPSVAQTSDLPIKTDHYKTKGFDCVIFPENYVGLGIGETKRFTPLRTDIDLAEKALARDLALLNKDKINQGKDYGPIIHKNLKKYKRQYLGFIDEKGNRILFINCFWAKEDNSSLWEEEMMIVLDGGSYYWSVYYNLDKGELYQLMVNGES